MPKGRLWRWLFPWCSIYKLIEIANNKNQKMYYEDVETRQFNVRSADSVTVWLPLGAKGSWLGAAETRRRLCRLVPLGNGIAAPRGAVCLFCAVRILPGLNRYSPAVALAIPKKPYHISLKSEICREPRGSEDSILCFVNRRTERRMLLLMRYYTTNRTNCKQNIVKYSR